MSWNNYFKSIKEVCPWSWQSYIENKIAILPFEDILPLEPYDAIVYKIDLDIDTLDEVVEALNEEYSQYEFLWSHPDHTKGGKNQTPVPVIIQQDRKLLESLRKGENHGVNS